MNLENKIDQLRKKASDQLDFEPQIFKANNEEDRKAVENILNKIEGVNVFDELLGQLQELAKSRNPKIEKFTVQDATTWIDAHLSGSDLSHYGVYVYYPWSKRLLHILDKEEFIEVRTNRNRNKITLEESKVLATKKVGVIGLSVGQSVSMTLAMERGFGEIRLADFDLLELTNLNRIRTGLQNLGISKVISVAREIKEMDPYLNVTAFTEGVTEENIDRFYTEGGLLDAVVDECDGLYIKILCRIKAKEYRIPVLMEASDRGTLDVERFDLEPDRPILHGYIDHLDFSAAKGLVTNEEKLPYLLSIAGIDVLSEKMKASMLEIGQTLTTWPQLASAVTFGGGMTADVCRRIFLNTYTESGRYNVDLEELIGNKSVAAEEEEEIVKVETDVLQNIRSNYEGKQDRQKAVLTENELDLILKSAIQAPSGGNTQPWQWELKNNSLLLHHAVDLSTQFLDYKHRGAYISFGCAIENVVLQAHSLGLEVLVQEFPDAQNLTMIAELSFYREKDVTGVESHDFDVLNEFQGKRCTNRKIGNPVKIESEKLELFRSHIESVEGTKLHLLERAEDIAKLGELVGIAERMLFTNQVSHKEFMNEVRWTREEAKSTRTGIEIASLDFNLSEITGFKLARNWEVVKQLKKWNGGGAFEKMGRKCINASSAMGLVSVPHYTELEYLRAGRGIQRGWIKANEMGISLQPMSALIFLFARLTKGDCEGLTQKMKDELEAIRPVYQKLFPDLGDRAEVFLFRLHVGKFHGPLSYRKFKEEVFVG